MSQLQGLNIETEGTGISKPLSEQVHLLGGLLGQVIRSQAGQEILDLIEALRLYCKQAALNNDAALLDKADRKIRRLDLDTMLWVLRAYTDFFILTNQAEQQEIVRINRERSRSPDAGRLRPESIAEAISDLKQQGYTFEQVSDVLARLDIQPTLTAHPTEARRPSILLKQQRITALLEQFSRTDLTPGEREETIEALSHQITLLFTTDAVRAESPDVEDEIRQGLYFLSRSIWETVGRIHQDIRRALRQNYGKAPPLSPFLRFRSWIGGDRDGNPNVTPEVTRRTVRLHRRAALDLFLEALLQLRNDLSLSARRVSMPPALMQSLEQDRDAIQLPDDITRRYRHEPYRLKISYILAQLQRLADKEGVSGGGYDIARFIEDLQIIRESLETGGFHDLAGSGLLDRLLTLAHTFGFHMAAVDIRQHSEMHEETVAALLRVADVTPDYISLTEQERLAVLTDELYNPRPLLPHGVQIPETAQMVLDTFAVIREAITTDPHAIGSYVVSMTHTVSDMLEVLLLAKEAGLWQLRDDVVASPLDIVPLFETIEDLEEAGARMQALIDHPVYRRHLAARGCFQEIMLGYSDSNKDGGYWMANWALHDALRDLGRVCRDADIDFRIFHGRGGTVGRGGGRANQAILAMPSAVHNGRIRFTEQGEVVSFRYSVPAIAHRHLEQIVNATIRVTAGQLRGDRDEYADEDTDHIALMNRLANASMQAYRRLIDHPDFWRWYSCVTPIEHISHLPIASRPVSRKSVSEVDFEGLRAIPWGFAWIQIRYLVPGWYGIGSAVQAMMDRQEVDIEQLRRMYRNWPFFRTLINNAQHEMARARCEIAGRYTRLNEEAGAPDAQAFRDMIETEFISTGRLLLQITEQRQLLDHQPVIQKSISLRNPYTDVLNLLQIELISRFRRASSSEEERERIRHAVFLSINGIAAAMQSTG